MPGCVLHKVSAVLSVSRIFAGQNGLKKPGMGKKKDNLYLYHVSVASVCQYTACLYYFRNQVLKSL